MAKAKKKRAKRRKRVAICDEMIAMLNKYDVPTFKKMQLRHWHLISLFEDLSTEFIRRYTDYLCWNALSFSQAFTDVEILEFADRICFHCLDENAYVEITPEIRKKYKKKFKTHQKTKNGQPLDSQPMNILYHGKATSEPNFEIDVVVEAVSTHEIITDNDLGRFLC